MVKDINFDFEDTMDDESITVNRPEGEQSNVIKDESGKSNRRHTVEGWDDLKDIERLENKIKESSPKQKRHTS